MIIKKFVKPPLKNNNYLIIDEISKEAILTDCSDYEPKIINILKENNLTLKYILLTHGHFDHLIGIPATLKALSEINQNPKVLMNEADKNVLKMANLYLQMLDLPETEIPSIDIFINEDSELNLGNTKIQIISTPGHTEGGLCYLIENSLFSGDTLFKEAVGRCDLEGGDFNSLENSIKMKLFTLPDTTVVYTGHGEDTTIGWEKNHNQFL